MFKKMIEGFIDILCVLDQYPSGFWLDDVGCGAYRIAEIFDDGYLSQIFDDVVIGFSQALQPYQLPIVKFC